MWCQGSHETQEYHLHKKGSVDPWDTQFPLETRNKAKFIILQMTPTYAGLYKCYYKSAAGFSEHSDPMELVVTGAYENPSLRVWPSPNVTSGVSITVRCSSPIGFGSFILIQEGKHNISWTLDSQSEVNQLFYALFVLDAVTPIHNGTFRCYGFFRNTPQVWSKSSDPLVLMVPETKNQSPTSTEDGLETYQKILIGVLVLLLLLFFLLLPILIRYLWSCKKKKANTSVKNIQSEDNAEVNSWNPSDENPQGIVYAQVKPSRIRKDTTSKETQVVIYAQLCSRTQE